MTRLRESIEDVINGGGPSITGPVGNNEPGKKADERTGPAFRSREELFCQNLGTQKNVALLIKDCVSVALLFL